MSDAAATARCSVAAPGWPARNGEDGDAEAAPAGAPAGGELVVRVRARSHGLRMFAPATRTRPYGAPLDEVLEYQAASWLRGRAARGRGADRHDGAAPSGTMGTGRDRSRSSSGTSGTEADPGAAGSGAEADRGASAAAPEEDTQEQIDSASTPDWDPDDKEIEKDTQESRDLDESPAPA